MRISQRQSLITTTIIPWSNGKHTAAASLSLTKLIALNGLLMDRLLSGNGLLWQSLALVLYGLQS